MQATGAPRPSSSTRDRTTDSRSSTQMPRRGDHHQELAPGIPHVVQHALVREAGKGARPGFGERRDGLVHVLATVAGEDGFEISGGPDARVRMS